MGLLRGQSVRGAVHYDSFEGDARELDWASQCFPLVSDSRKNAFNQYVGVCTTMCSMEPFTLSVQIFVVGNTAMLRLHARFFDDKASS